MTYTFDGNNYILVLEKGEELLQTLRTFANGNDIASAWVSAIGGATEVELGFYNLEAREYQWQTFSALCEITSLNGNLSFDEKDKPVFHLHGNFADESYQSVGGHVNKLVVGGTCEVFLQPFAQKVTRVFDDDTGLKLMQL